MEHPRRRSERGGPLSRRGALDLVVVGHTNLDHLFHVDRLPESDRTTPLRDREVRLGGTAANIARAAAKLGVRASLVSRVGPDFPLQFRRMLTTEGVDLSGFETVRRSRSPACFIVESTQGEQVALIDQGPMEHDPGTPIPASLIARTGWVHLATGNPLYQLRVLDQARRAGVRVAADPAQEIFYRWDGPSLRRLLGASEIFFGNRGEIAKACDLLGFTHPRDLVRIVPLVVETRGAQGVTATTRTGQVRAPAVKPRNVRQVTGAGDGFRGGFYAGWFRGDPLLDCLRYGAWAASRWLERGDPSALRPRGPRPGRALMLGAT